MASTNDETSAVATRTKATERSARINQQLPTRIPASEPSKTPYPVEHLTPSIRDAVTAITNLTQAPAALCVHSVLAAVSVATSKFGRVQTLSPGGPAPVAQFFAGVAESGERKTAADKLAARGVEAAFDAELARFEVECRRHKAACDDHAGGEPEPEVPILRAFLVTDPTTEGMVKVIEKGAGFVGLLTDEAGTFIGGHSMSAEQRGKTGAMISRLWDLSRTIRPRASRDGLGIVPATPTTLNLMFQPNFLADLYGDMQLVSQGFLSRVLPVWPESAMGNRPYRAPSAEDLQIVADFAVKTEHLITQALASDAGRGELVLSKEARSACVIFHDWIEGKLGSGQSYRDISGFAAKAPEHACRLAGMMTLFEDPDAHEVSGDVMKAACHLLRFYLEEFRHLRAASAADTACNDARTLLEWLLQNVGAGKSASRERLQQFGPVAIRRAKELNPAVKILIEHGAVRVLPEGTKVDGKARRAALQVHPKAHLALK